ncbi:hypothetical protein L3i22_041330 [Actinoplanes sp. L3-i22]|nr:hypothetical protein L3i22_041330 [Actinoplanes sp. L3-i22]
MQPELYEVADRRVCTTLFQRADGKWTAGIGVGTNPDHADYLLHWTRETEEEVRVELEGYLAGLLPPSNRKNWDQIARVGLSGGVSR